MIVVIIRVMFVTPCTLSLTRVSVMLILVLYEVPLVFCPFANTVLFFEETLIGATVVVVVAGYEGGQNITSVRYLKWRFTVAIKLWELFANEAEWRWKYVRGFEKIFFSANQFRTH